MENKTNAIGQRTMKAQFWSFDVVFAIVIFGFAITILALAWYGINSQLSFASGGGATLMQLQSSAFAQRLLSPGYPGTWQSQVNPTSTSTWANVSVGLTQSATNGSISSAKLYALEAMAAYNYQASKQTMGVSYDYYIIITGQTINASIGENPSTNNAVTVVVQRRSAVLNGAPVNVKILLWTASSLGTA